MYDYIKGYIAELTPTTATIEAAGVGFFINISLNTAEAITALKETKLYTVLVINSIDYSQTLYGFATKIEREMFKLLTSVSGVGSNTARIMLSTYKANELANLIATNNTQQILKTKGIGPKTAERVVLELKSKVLSIADDSDYDLTSSSSHNHNASEAIEALTILGFNKNVTEKAVQKLLKTEPDISTEDIIRKALALL